MVDVKHVESHNYALMSRKNLKRFEADPANFMERCLTQDEIGFITLNQKQKKVNAVETPSITPSQEDEKGVVLVDYLPKGKRINVKYYANFLKQLRQLKAKTPRKVDKRCLAPSGQCPTSQVSHCHGYSATESGALLVSDQQAWHPQSRSFCHSKFFWQHVLNQWQWW